MKKFTKKCPYCDCFITSACSAANHYRYYHKDRDKKEYSWLIFADSDVPKLCGCGCGEELTPLGWKDGIRFKHNHHLRIEEWNPWWKKGKRAKNAIENGVKLS